MTPEKGALKATRFEGVYKEGRDYFTLNLVPGVSVYGERLKRSGGREYRFWDPSRSKAAALLKKGCSTFPFGPDTEVLYLGAATGTTPSHISDICRDGHVHAVEFSSRSFRKLVQLSGQRGNIVPLMHDANHPERYRRFVRRVDVLYQDVSQRNQTEIFVKNIAAFRPRWGLLMLKARSVDVGEGPRKVFKASRGELEDAGLRIVEEVLLEPFEKDHMCFTVQA